MTWTFVVPGEPVAKGRPRASVGPGGKFARMYTPQKSARFEQRVSACAREQLGLTRLEGPLLVEIDALFEWPLSQRRKNNPRGQEPMIQKPDADNIAKAVLDGLSPWFADQQVAVLIVRKWRAPQAEVARTVVGISLLGGGQ